MKKLTTLNIYFSIFVFLSSFVPYGLTAFVYFNTGKFPVVVFVAPLLNIIGILLMKLSFSQKAFVELIT